MPIDPKGTSLLAVALIQRRWEKVCLALHEQIRYKLTSASCRLTSSEDEIDFIQDALALQETCNEIARAADLADTYSFDMKGKDAIPNTER